MMEDRMIEDDLVPTVVPHKTTIRHSIQVIQKQELQAEKALWRGVIDQTEAEDIVSACVKARSIMEAVLNVCGEI